MAAGLKNVWGSTSLLILGRIWGSLCTLTYLALLARHLSDEGFGRLTFYLAVFGILDAVVDLGTGQAAVQLSATRPERINGVIAAARRVRLATGLAGVALVGGGAFLGGEPGAAWILLASCYPITHLLELSTLVFKNEIQWSRPVAVRAGAAGASLLAVLVLRGYGSEDPAHYLCAVALGSTLGNVGLHLVGRRFLPPRGGERVATPALLKLAIPMGAAGICQQAYFWVDNLFVRAFDGDAELGRYNLAVRVLSFGIMAGTYAAMTALPWLTREHQAGRLGNAVTRLAQPTFAIACAVAAVLMQFSGDILVLLGGEEHFRGAEGALHWLLVAMALVYLGAPLLTAVVAMKQSTSVMWVAVTALGVNVGLNSWLVPTRGIEGAALATCVTEGTVALGALLVLMRAGQRPQGRPLHWLLGPLLFALAISISG